MLLSSVPYQSPKNPSATFSFIIPFDKYMSVLELFVSNKSVGKYKKELRNSYYFFNDYYQRKSLLIAKF